MAITVDKNGKLIEIEDNWNQCKKLNAQGFYHGRFENALSRIMIMFLYLIKSNAIFLGVYKLPI